MKDDTSKQTEVSADEAAKPNDVVLLHGRTEDGQGIRALRARERQLELAEIRPVKKGKPLGSGEIVRLRPHEELPLICDVEVLYKPDEARESGDSRRPGPPHVSSATYRRNWEAIFGNRDTDIELN